MEEEKCFLTFTLVVRGTNAGRFEALTQLRLKIDSSTREYAQHLLGRGLRWRDTPARRRGRERHLHLDPRRRRARGGGRRVSAYGSLARRILLALRSAQKEIAVSLDMV